MSDTAKCQQQRDPKTIMDELVEDLAGDTGALTVWASTQLGAHVTIRPDAGTTHETDLADRLSLLVYAVKQLRCRKCSGLATGHGRICQACEAAEGVGQ